MRRRSCWRKPQVPARLRGCGHQHPSHCIVRACCDSYELPCSTVQIDVGTLEGTLSAKHPHVLAKVIVKPMPACQFAESSRSSRHHEHSAASHHQCKFHPLQTVPLHHVFSIDIAPEVALAKLRCWGAQLCVACGLLQPAQDCSRRVVAGAQLLTHQHRRERHAEGCHRAKAEDLATPAGLPSNACGP